MHDIIRKQLEDTLQESITAWPVHSGEMKTESGKSYFLKIGSKSSAYCCEVHGLEELIKSFAINIVHPVACGDNFILTEFVKQSRIQNNFFENFGRKLAHLHKFKGTEFGFYEDNFIGANEQINRANDDEKSKWVAFYFNKRLLFQYKLAEKNGFVSNELKSNFAKLESRIDSILEDSSEEPSLLHGDLWSGNFLCNNEGEPVLIDPAVYYGHREAELAMTKLFGGFSPDFYEAYQKEYLLQEGWKYREDIYKLYHVLNHLNLFGKSYLSEAEWIIKKYVKE